MEQPAVTSRQQAYIEILRWSLLAIREAAYAGKVRLCEIEADHIHNLPSLLYEANEARHACYMEKERTYYLERLNQLAAAEYLQSQLPLYVGPWKVLAARLGSGVALERRTPEAG